MKTKVQFLLEINEGFEGQVFAFFPEEQYGHDSLVFDCYAHVGQHSGCSVDYANTCDFASPEQYADLKTELESIGYDLEILAEDETV